MKMPERKIRLGFVGVGFMGQVAHLANYAVLPDCEVAAIAEIRPQLAQRVATRYGVRAVYADHREMLDRETLDGVIAAQPFDRHAALLPELYGRVACLFTEKPLAVGAATGARLADAAAVAGCVHMVGYHKRSDPATVHTRSIIDNWRASGRLGRLTYVRILMPAGDWIAGGAADLLGTDEPVPATAREGPPADFDPETGKQYIAFVNYYIHQVNLLRHLLGEPYRVVHADRAGVLLVAETGSGATGVIEMSPYQTTRGWEESALIAFEHGYIVLHLPAPLAVNQAGTVEIYEDDESGSPVRTKAILPPIHAMRQQAATFVKVCRGEAAPPCDAAEAAEDLRVAEAYIRMRAAR